MTAVESAPEEAKLIVGRWADDQVALTQDKLTIPQRAFYKEQLTGILMMSDINDNEALKILSSEGPERSTEIATVIKRAASQNRPDLLEVLGQYNRSNRSIPE
jgi:conjugal transfer mating pair stabilization protein TraG